VGVLEARLAGRRGDASDADVAVMRGQVLDGVVDWVRVDAAGDAVGQVMRVLGVSRETLVKKLL
jgi:predicted kinase